MRNVATVILLFACGGSGKDEASPDATDGDADTDADSDADADQDGDGYIPPGDCDDADPLVYPGADETIYDGVDSDCSGDSDYDADLDGEDSDAFGGTDCDDDDPEVNTSGTETCNGIDDDCDGDTDDDAEDGTNYWTDLDQDGHGDPDLLFSSCDPPPGAVTVGDDCDDTNPDVYPAAPDVPCDLLDNDCNAATSEAGGGVTLDGAPAADLAAALAGASTGSTVELCEGEYAVSGLVVADGVTMRGGGSAITTLDGGGTAPVLTVATSSPVTLEGLTLTGGVGLGPGGDNFGGGLLVATNADVTGVDLVVTGNRAGVGAGISTGAGVRLSLTDCLVTANEGDPALAIVSTGGGLYVGDGSQVTLTNTWVSANTAGQCGGGMLEADVVVTGDGASGFDANEALSLGGGGLCLRDRNVLTDLDVTNNVAANVSGGIDAGAVVMDGVTVSGNHSALDGGGMSLAGVSELTSCTIRDNIADVDGGGIRAYFPATIVTITDSEVSNNTALFGFAIGGGAQLSLEATLESVNTDWGGVNVPHDVGLAFAGAFYDWAGVASFVCTDGDSGACL